MREKCLTGEREICMNKYPHTCVHVITLSHDLYCIVLLYRASLKLGLDKAVLQSMNTQQQSGGVSLCVSNYNLNPSSQC